MLNKLFFVIFGFCGILVGMMIKFILVKVGFNWLLLRNFCIFKKIKRCIYVSLGVNELVNVSDVNIVMLKCFLKIKY